MPANPNICLVVYPVCIENAAPQYLYIGNTTYDIQYDIFTLDDYFITINLPSFLGTFYTAGLCPALIGDVCNECVYNPVGALQFESISIEAPTNGETCFGNNCIILQNCENDSEQLIATANLSFYIGSVVKVLGSDKCWRVLPNGPCSGSQEYTIESVCEDCITCLPVVEPEIPHVVPQYFEDFTQTADTQNEIATNVKFANAYWDLFKSLKHGIESNCNTVDIDQITIKKRACDINKLYDAEACTITTPPVDVPCEEPTGIPLPEPFVS